MKQERALSGTTKCSLLSSEFPQAKQRQALHSKGIISEIHDIKCKGLLTGVDPSII